MEVEDSGNRWNYNQLPWNKVNAEIKGDILKNKLKLRKKKIDRILFKKRLKSVDPYENEQKFIDACMKLDDKDNIDEYKVVFTDIWKDNLDEEKVNFFYDIISQYDTKVSKIKIQQVFYFDNIYFYSYIYNIKTMFLSVDDLYWKYRFSGAANSDIEAIKNIDKNLADFWSDSSLYKDLEKVRIVSEAIPISERYDIGYFHDYAKDYYLGDVIALNLSKKEFNEIVNKTKYTIFVCNSIKYRVYIIESSKFKFIKSKFLKWPDPVFICVDNNDVINKAINSYEDAFTFFSEKGYDRVNEMKEGLKYIKLNNKTSYFYLNIKFRPINFCPSCILFNNQIKYNIFYKCSIDFNEFINRCLEFKILVFPAKSIYFNNLESVYNICVIYMFISKMKKTDNIDYLVKLKNILLIYVRNRNIFDATSVVYKKFRKMVLEYIDGLSNNFYYSRYVKLYKQSNELIIEYQKIMSYYYEGSDVLKYIDFWGLASVPIKNFTDRKILDVITGVNNACYQVVNFLSKDVASYLRTAGVLCYSVLMDGYVSCIPDIRSHCIFMGGLENTKKQDDIFNKISILVDVKKHRDEMAKQTETNSFKRAELVNQVTGSRIRNAIRNVLNDKENNNIKNLDEKNINNIFYIIKNISEIYNYILNEVNDLLKDKYVMRFENTNSILSNYPLDSNINNAILSIIGYIDEHYDEIDKMLDTNTNEFMDVWSVVYDVIEEINDKKRKNNETNGMIRRGEIDKKIEDIKKIDVNKLAEKNLSNRIRYNVKLKKK